MALQQFPLWMLPRMQQIPGQTPPFVPGQIPGTPPFVLPGRPAPVPLPGGAAPSSAIPLPGGGPAWLQKIQGGFDKLMGLGQTANPMLSPQEQQAAQQRQRMTMASALMQAAAPRPVGTSSPLAAIGGAMQAGQQANDAFTADALRAKLMQAQIGALQAETQQQPQGPSFSSPVGKMLADLDAAEQSGNTFAASQLKTAIQQELGGDVPLSEVRSIRNDLIQDSKAYLEQQRGYENVVAAAQNPGPASDLALIFGVMKVLDPGSIVRESEVQLTADAGSLAQRVAGIYSRVFKGESLTESQRKDFVNMAQTQFKSASETQERLIDDSRSFAERHNIALEDAVPDFVVPQPLQPIQFDTPQNAPPSRTLDNPLTPQEMDELNSLRRELGFGG